VKLRDFLEFNGFEIANENRVRAYLEAGLLGGGPRIVSTDCGCDATDTGPYISPETDPAPWYDDNYLSSADYLGLMLHDARLDPVIARAVTPRFSGGATIGRMRPRHRIVAVRGLMLASSELGMRYGELWLTDVLAGTITGCAADTLRILLGCPDDDYAEVPYRTLRQTGIVEGPNFSPIAELPECYLQEVTFQLAAGIPHLLSEPATCMSQEVSA